MSNNDPITMRDLDAKLRAFRWETRFWYLVVLVASNAVPVGVLSAITLWPF